MGGGKIPFFSGGGGLAVFRPKYRALYFTLAQYMLSSSLADILLLSWNKKLNKNNRYCKPAPLEENNGFKRSYDRYLLQNGFKKRPSQYTYTHHHNSLHEGRNCIQRRELKSCLHQSIKCTQLAAAINNSRVGSKRMVLTARTFLEF
jgi:hypothetical protein